MWDCRGKGKLQRGLEPDLRSHSRLVLFLLFIIAKCGSGFKLNAHIVEFQRIHPEGKVYKFNQSLSSQIIIDTINSY